MNKEQEARSSSKNNKLYLPSMVHHEGAFYLRCYAFSVAGKIGSKRIN
jgi:hypothetical protein